MTDVPAHPTQLNIEILRKGERLHTRKVVPTYRARTSAVELVAKEVTEAQAILDEATEQKTAINKIPQRKAGGGKGD
jgi:hypothetical protein